MNQRRNQLVKINQSTSDILPSVSSGVPQRSILGPLIFLIFINDLPGLVNFVQQFMFADDTKLMHPICYPRERYYFQQDIESIIEWSVSNNIVFNENKFVLLNFHNHISRSPSPVGYRINERLINLRSTHKDLGITISTDISWRVHDSVIISKAVLSKRSHRRLTKNCKVNLNLTSSPI